MRGDFGRLRQCTTQSKRESADRAWASIQRYESFLVGRIVSTAKLCPNSNGFANLLHRYPSPDRPAYSPSRPVTVFCRFLRKIRGDIGYHNVFAIYRCVDRTMSGAMRTTDKGIEQCKRHRSFLQWWQYSVWQVALKAILSVVWPAQALVSSQQRSWAQTQPAQPWLVQPLACFATTQVSTAAAKHGTAPLTGAIIKLDRRRGMTPAAVFVF